MARRLDDVRLAVLMFDGIDLKGRTNVVALRDHLGRDEDPARAVGGIDRERHRGHGPPGRPGRARARHDPRGALACSTAPRPCERPCVTCSASAHWSNARIRQKERNISEHLPERDRVGVRRRLRQAWDDPEHGRASSARSSLERPSFTPKDSRNPCQLFWGKIKVSTKAG